MREFCKKEVAAVENKYDNPVFFEKYGNMLRSKEGLAGAGEWETLKAMLPDFAGKRVLDLGCGYGWHCAWAADHGAASVVGADCSQRMLEAAREKNAREAVEYRLLSIEEAAFPPESFDVVISSLALHYVADLQAVYHKIYGWLAPGGVFVFTAEHPVFTAQGPQDWVYDGEGQIRHFPVDSYFYEGERQSVFLGEPVKKHHRTLTSYIDGLLEEGFSLLHVREPRPPAGMMELPGMADEMRRPMMLAVSARKGRG